LFWQGFLSSNYHSLQAAITRQFSKGLMVKGAYTYSKAINWTDDDGWAGLNWNDPNILRRNRAQAGFNTPQIFQLAYVYELPLGKNKQWRMVAARLRRSSAAGRPAAFSAPCPANPLVLRPQGLH